jgi:hypothetical protein
LAPDGKLKSKRQPKTVGEIDTFVTMLRAACDDRKVYVQMQAIAAAGAMVGVTALRRSERRPWR